MNLPQYSRELQLEKGYEALNWLIDQSSQAQDAFKSNEMRLGGQQHAFENCTIKFKTARQCGHTSLLVRLAYERFTKAIIITPKMVQQKYIRDELLNLSLKNYPNSPVTMGCVKDSNFLALSPKRLYQFTTLSSGREDYPSCRGNHTEAILVDCASNASENDIERIYQNLAPCMSGDSKKFFVFFE